MAKIQIETVCAYPERECEGCGKVLPEQFRGRPRLRCDECRAERAKNFSKGFAAYLEKKKQGFPYDTEIEERNKRVCDLLGKGLTVRQIGEEMGLSHTMVWKIAVFTKCKWLRRHQKRRS